MTNSSKVRARGALAKEAASLRRDGCRVVMTNGCFDLLHVGHLRYLQAARALGDRLVVGINSDASVRGLKGTDRPVVPQDERAEMLAGLRCVDFVTVFDEPDPLALVQALKPDVLVKGGDWTPDRIVGREVVESLGGRVVSLPLIPGRSTTGLLEQIRAEAREGE